jgi:hypothetical protein
MTTPTTNNHTDSLKTPCSHSSAVVSIDVVTGNDKKLRNRQPLQTSRRSGVSGLPPEFPGGPGSVATPGLTYSRVQVQRTCGPFSEDERQGTN